MISIKWTDRFGITTPPFFFQIPNEKNGDSYIEKLLSNNVILKFILKIQSFFYVSVWFLVTFWLWKELLVISFVLVFVRWKFIEFWYLKNVSFSLPLKFFSSDIFYVIFSNALDSVKDSVITVINTWIFFTPLHDWFKS